MSESPLGDQSVWIVTATYNEAENLPRLVERLWSALPSLHLVVVDDGSPDGTGELADRLAVEHPGQITVLHRPRKSGYASAHREGIGAALEQGAPAVITMDADLSHDPAAIPSMLAALENNDMVIGSRYISGGGVVGWNWFRSFLSIFGGRVVTRLFTGLRPLDCTSGFRGYRAEILRRIGLEQSRAEGYGFLVEMLFRCQRSGARIAEVPITYMDRRQGQSKLSKRIILESALLCFRLLGERVFQPRRWSR